MNTRIEEEKSRIRTLCQKAATELYGFCPEFTVERPRDRRNGDFASSAALALGGALKRRPSLIAAEMAEKITLRDGEWLEPGGKGFLNFHLRPDFLLSFLEPAAELPYLPIPDPGSPEFDAVYPYHRLRKILELRGRAPEGRQDTGLLTSPYEVRLLWALADGKRDELELSPDFPPLAEARYILLNNALRKMYCAGKELS